MPCYSPITGYRSKEINPTGKRSIVFNPAKAEQRDQALQISCGQCIGCRLERSRRWAVRCMHEAQMHRYSCFLTLTYSDEFLPSDGTLVLKDFQDFMKRLRKRVVNQVRVCAGNLFRDISGDIGGRFEGNIPDSANSLFPISLQNI